MSHKIKIKRQLELDGGPCALCASNSAATHTCKEHMHAHIGLIDKSADAAYKASLELIFAHVADIHMTILSILSKEYGHSVEEMLTTVTNHSDWKSIYLHPVLKSLVYFPPKSDK